MGACASAKTEKVGEEGMEKTGEASKPEKLNLESQNTKA
jgi:hypothetical protein